MSDLVEEGHEYAQYHASKADATLSDYTHGQPNHDDDSTTVLLRVIAEATTSIALSLIANERTTKGQS